MPTATPFNNLITFSRGSNATVTGSNGLIQWAPNNVLTSSQSFTTSGWFVDGAVVTPSTGVAPDGTTTATSIALGTGGNRVYQFDNSGVLGSKVFSLHVKAGVGSTVVIAAIGAMSPAGNTTVNAATGTASGLPGVSIVSVGDGWYRVSIPTNVSAASGNGTYWTIAATGGAVFIWGAQLELGSTATTYNPTTVKNLLGFSEAFDNAAWTKSGTSIVTGAQANPVNGLFNAQKLMENTASGEHRTFFTIITAPNTYTYSVYLKAAERTFASLIHLTVSPQPSIVVNLTTGAITSPTNVTASGAVNVGNGWWRVWMTYTTTTSTTSYPQVMVFSNATTGNYVGDGNSGVYIYGAQLSDSASLDPYVPTPGAAPSSTAFYGPRFDFDPVTLQPRGILIEEQRTNLTQYSQDFTNAWWTKTNLNVATGAGIAPDGTNTANSAIPTAVLGTHYFTRSITSAATNTVSWYVKPTGSYTKVAWFEEINTGNYATFDLSGAGSIITTSGATATITAVGNGWYRITATAASPGGTGFSLWFIPQTYTSGSPIGTWTPNGTDGFLVWAAQFEAGAFTTSYIPTVASTVTRSADVATISGSLFAQWYGQTEGTFVIDYRQGEGTTARSAAVANDGTNNNTIELYIDGSTDATTLPFYGVYVGGAVQAALSFAAAAANSNHKMAGAYRTNDFAASVDGSSVATDTSGTLPTPTRLTIGANGPATGSFANGHIRNIRFIPARAADFQLQALSTQPIVDYFFLQTAAGDQLVAGNDDYLYSLPILG